MALCKLFIAYNVVSLRTAIGQPSAYIVPLRYHDFYHDEPSTQDLKI